MRVSINDQILKDIADSIRTKTDTTAEMYPQDMASKIDDIEVANLQSKSITITNNGTQTITPDETYNGLSEVNITANVALDLSNYFTIPPENYNPSLGYSVFNYMIKNLPDNFYLGDSRLDYSSFFRHMFGLKTAPTYNFSHAQNVNYMFANCQYLESVPQYDFSNVIACSAMFENCYRLKNVPAFNMPNANNIYNMFSNCQALTNESLNNILATCITITQISSSSKTLQWLFGRNMSTYYPAATIQGLSNYAAFTAAGWTIGW